ncbi:hypothetical protein [Roseibium album]|uniref:hypothetical protein n=1 Tax=Roseibium album TaxID=311410 RepID=UPI00249299ED|nr:hypothetical protein [Roseibium album]
MAKLIVTIFFMLLSIQSTLAHERIDNNPTPDQIAAALEKLFLKMKEDKSTRGFCGQSGVIPFSTIAASNQPKFIVQNIDDTHPKTERRNYRICNFTPKEHEGDADIAEVGLSEVLVVESTLSGTIRNQVKIDQCIDIINAVEIHVYTGTSSHLSAGIYCQIP